MPKMSQDMMRLPTTGDTDHDFAAMMREHHRGVADMAHKVIEDQEKEIRQPDAWRERYPPRRARR